LFCSLIVGSVEYEEIKQELVERKRTNVWLNLSGQCGGNYPYFLSPPSPPCLLLPSPTWLMYTNIQGSKKESDIKSYQWKLSEKFYGSTDNTRGE
jgi:hypothetical protein